MQTDCNVDFMQHMLPTLVWPAVLVSAEAVGMKGIPSEFSHEMLGNRFRDYSSLKKYK